MSNFEEVGAKRKSEVWQHFLFCKSTEKAKCKLCQTILKASGSSTKGLIIHLKSKHKIEVKSCLDIEDRPKPQIRKIDSFLKSKKPSLEEILSQLTAVDGLTFNQIARSERLHQAFKADGYVLPKTHQHVRNLVIKNFENVKKLVKEELDEIKLNNGRFSITFDASTSARSRRYMNINCHFQGGFHSLGLVRIHGSMDTKKAIRLVEDRLNCFGLDLNTDIVAMITDGASLIVKFGKETSPLHVICYAHAIHLAICDVLYKRQPSAAFSDDLDSDSASAEEEGTDDEKQAEKVDKAPTLSPDIQFIVKKVRKIVKIFRRSPVKNDDALQPFILETLGKEKKLQLDCKTRWNSLLSMLERFYELRKEIKMALVQLDIQFELTEEDMMIIKELCDALAPIKVAVEALSSEDADILLAEKVIAFTLKKLCEQGTKIGQELKSRFEARIKERRNAELVHLLKYLKNASYLDQPQDQFGHKVKRPKIAALATNILQRLFLHYDGNEDNPENLNVDGAMVVRDQEKPMTLAQELHAFVEDDETEDTKNTDLSAHVVQKEMLLYETSKRRPKNLERLFTALKTIKPTSVEAERAFSALGYFANKIRSQMNDATLDALIFQRQYYKK